MEITYHLLPQGWGVAFWRLATQDWQASNKVYAQSLHELEADGLIRKKAYPVSPPYVEYSLTDEGVKILPIIKEMAEWGKSISENIEKAYQS